MQLICVPQTRVPRKVSSALSGSPGNLGVKSRGPSGLGLQVSVGRGTSGVSSGPPTQVSDPRRDFVTMGPIGARTGVKGAPGRGCGRPRRGARDERRRRSGCRARGHSETASRPAPRRPPGPSPALTALGAPRCGPGRARAPPGPFRPR